MGDVGELEGRGVLAVNVQPDEAIWTDCATENLGKVDQVDCRVASANDREDGVEICGAKRGSRIVGGGEVDGGRVDGFGEVMEAGYGRVGRHDWIWSERGSEVVSEDHCTNIEYRCTWMKYVNGVDRLRRAQVESGQR